MAKTKEDKQNKSRMVAFRLTDEQMAPFALGINEAEVSQSEFFRRLVLSSNPVFEKSSKDYDRLLFYFSKSSNNLNQLAHNVHRQSQRGIVSEALYVKFLNELIGIRELLSAGVNGAD